ncbi:MAG: diguanylate cyclase, partial [Thermodesulfobacteriota bacterium]|nr:diguanylate cyclase [Thermodesulfobacteriota bacterium]
MNYSESPPQAGEFLRLTLGFLAKHNLSATPVNYTVWYEYASGKNPKLIQAINQMLDTTKAIIQSGSRLQTRMKVSSEDLKQLHKELEVSQKEA